MTVAEDQTSIADRKDYLQSEPSRESSCQRNAYVTYSVNRLETRELEVVGGWDFSCVNARKWQRLPLTRRGVNL